MAGLLDAIGPGDRVTIVDRFGKEHSGRAVMRGPAGWVLNMGGAHGRPGIATAANITRVSRAKTRAKTRASSSLATRRLIGNPDIHIDIGSHNARRSRGAKTNPAVRAITQDDINAAAKGLRMVSLSADELRALVRDFEGKEAFASQVIAAAAKQMLAAKKRVGLIRNPARGRNRTVITAPYNWRAYWKTPHGELMTIPMRKEDAEFWAQEKGGYVKELKTTKRNPARRAPPGLFPRKSGGPVRRKKAVARTPASVKALSLYLVQVKNPSGWHTVAWFPYGERAKAIEYARALHRKYPAETHRIKRG